MVSAKQFISQLFLASALLAAGVGAAAAQPVTAGPASIEGTWRSLGGSEVTIQPCGEGYCGHLSWIVIPNEQWLVCSTMPAHMFAPLIQDYNNPDKAKQSRSLLGANILRVTATEEPDAYDAVVYNAEDGSTNAAKVWVEGGNLRLGGLCSGTICEVNQYWPRVADRRDAPGYSCG